MANLPYVTAPGNVAKALNTIVLAATPPKITQDFVREILKIPSGSGAQITSFLKKIGMANPDGTPTDIYKKFRNEATQSEAALLALRHGYVRLYERNEYMHTLSERKLEGLVIEETGADKKSSVIRYTIKCIQGIAGFISKDVESLEKKGNERDGSPTSVVEDSDLKSAEHLSEIGRGVGMNLSYTINLNLPATSDIAVFNAIFKSVKENLLRD